MRAEKRVGLALCGVKGEHSAKTAEPSFGVEVRLVVCGVKKRLGRLNTRQIVNLRGKLDTKITEY